MGQLGVQSGIQLTHAQLGTLHFENYFPRFVFTFNILGEGSIVILSQL